MTKYLNPKYEEAFIGPQISESTKWKGLLTWFSHLDKAYSAKTWWQKAYLIFLDGFIVFECLLLLRSVWMSKGIYYNDP